MWPWLWIILAAFESPAHAQPGTPPKGRPALISPSSVGPKSVAEANLLLQEGQTAFREGQHAKAAQSLQRWVDRYPDRPGYVKAQLMLGISRLELKEPAKAIAPLKYVLTAEKADSPDAENARLRITTAYIETGKFHEAYLMTEESLNALNPKKISKATRAEILLLRAQALIGMNRDLRAEQALDSARKDLGAIAPDSRLKGQTAWLALTLKARACAKLPSPGKLEEGQVLQQLKRRGLCLQEAALMFNDALIASEPSWADRAATDLSTALSHYSRACDNPPAPPGKRTRKELTRYRQELARRLRKECAQSYAKIAEWTESWRKDISSTMTPYLDQVSKSLERLRSSDFGATGG